MKCNNCSKSITCEYLELTEFGNPWYFCSSGCRDNMIGLWGGFLLKSRNDGELYHALSQVPVHCTACKTPVSEEKARDFVVDDNDKKSHFNLDQLSEAEAREIDCEEFKGRWIFCSQECRIDTLSHWTDVLRFSRNSTSQEGDPDAIRAGINSDPDAPSPGSLWKHNKTGGIYEVLFVALDVEGLVPKVVYKSVVSGGTWTRSLDFWKRPDNGKARFSPYVAE